MTKAKTTKRALLLSVLSMMLCMAMLVGSTFAWFQDSVTSGANRIVAGNLDVELYYNNASTDGWADASAANVANPNFFVDQEGNAILWEPGAMAVTQFKVANVGSLALKYSLATIKADFNTLNGRDLSEVIKLAVIANDKYTAGATTRDDILALNPKFDDFTGFKAEGHLLPEEKATDDEPFEEIFTVVAYWEPNVEDDNLYNVNNNKEVDKKDVDENDREINRLYINIEIQLTANQYTYEEDSFNKYYDLDMTGFTQDQITEVLTEMGYAPVADEADFKEAVKEGKPIVLTDDVEAAFSNDVNKVPLSFNDADADVIIDLNGHELKCAPKTGGTGIPYAMVVNAGNVAITDSFGTGGVKDTILVTGTDASLTIDDVNVNAVSVKDGAKLTINGGEFTSVTGSKSDDNAPVPEVTLNGGTFKEVGVTGGIVNIYGSTVTEKIGAAGTTYNIYDGTFAKLPNASGMTVNIYGGTFTDAGSYSWKTSTYTFFGGTFGNRSSAFPDGYLAEGKKCIKIADKTYSVVDK